MINFIFIVACMLAQFCHGMYEDQVGEYDWTIENIGFVEQTVYMGKMMFVTTSDGVLACLNTRSGKIDWRVVLPTGGHVTSIVADKSTLYTVSGESSVVEAWSTFDGTLLWSELLNVESMRIFPSTGVTEMLLTDPSTISPTSSPSASPSSLFVLHNNCVHVLDKTAGKIASVVCGDENLHLKSIFPQGVDLDGRRVVFTHLEEALSKGLHTSSPTSLHLLSGCIQNVFTNQKCESAFVLDGSLVPTTNGLAAGKVNLQTAHVFTGIVDVLDYTSVHASLKLTWGEFSGTDIFYSMARDVNDKAVEVKAVHLRTNSQLSSVSLFTSNSKDELSLLTKMESFRMQNKPIVAVCSANSCVASTLHITAPVKGSDGDTNSEVLRPSLMVNDVISCDGESASLAFERSLHNSHTATMLACTSVPKVSWGSEKVCSSVTSADSQTCRDGSGVGEKAVRSLAVIAWTELTSKSGGEVRIEVPLQDSVSVIHQISHTFVSRYTSQSAATKGQTMLKVLVRSSTGNLVYLQQNEVRWERPESLSRIQKGAVVILDNPYGGTIGGGSGNGRGVDKTAQLLEDVTSLPSFGKRLEMQKKDLMFKLESAWQNILNIPSGLVGIIQESIPPPLADTLEPLLGPLLHQLLGLQGTDGIAGERTRKNTAEYTENTALFGFNKMSVVLSAECDLEGQHQVPLSCLQSMQVSALDIVTGDVLWTFQPVFPLELTTSTSSSTSSDANFNPRYPVAIWARLLKIRSHSRGSHPPEIALVVSASQESSSSSSSALLSFHFNAVTGAQLYVPSSSDSSQDFSVRGPTRVLMNAGHVVSSQMLTAPLKSSHDDSDYGHAHHGLLQYALVHSYGNNHDDGSDGNSRPVQVSVFPPLLQGTHDLSGKKTVNAAKGGVFVHQITGTELVSYQIDSNGTSKKLKFSRSPFNTPDHDDTITVLPALAVGAYRAVQSTMQEKIVSVKYPLPFVAVNSPVRVLGDDSLLLKYLNPHMVVIVTEHKKSTASQVPAASANTGEDTAENTAGDENTAENTVDDDVNELFVSVVDTVSAQVIHRYSIIHGASPVVTAIVENGVFVSYWNSVAQRSELSSVSLYEGMIDRNGLGPFSGSKVDPTRSAFNAPAPIALQKTFTLPRAITAMHHTATERGITNKNLLLGFNTGQLYSLDTRMVDPRRPINAPTQAEKEERLQQYYPQVPIFPHEVLSVNYTLPHLRQIVTSSAFLESTSLVMTTGLDVFFTRSAPSKGFDMLASDFNKPLLTLIVGGMGFAVLILRRIKQKKMIDQAWV